MGEAQEKLSIEPFTVPAVAAKADVPAESALTRSKESKRKAEAACNVDDDSNLTAAEKWLKSEPRDDVVRFTFKDPGDIGLRISDAVPPCVLEVRDGSLGAKKAPKPPL